MSSKRRSPRIENVTANNRCNGTDDFDVVDYIAEVKDVESKYEWTPDQLKALDASDVTVKHKRRGEALEECFLNGIGLIKDKNGGQKWAKMLELVPNKDFHGLFLLFLVKRQMQKSACATECLLSGKSN